MVYTTEYETKDGKTTVKAPKPSVKSQTEKSDKNSKSN